MNELSDYQLVLQYHTNNKEALELLYKRYNIYLSKIALQFFKKHKIDKSFELQDIKSFLVEKAFIPCVNTIEISMIDESFELQKRMNWYIKTYKKHLRRDFTRYSKINQYGSRELELLKIADDRELQQFEFIDMKISVERLMDEEEFYDDEKHVYDMLKEGYSYGEISELIDILPDSVRKKKYKLIRKLQYYL